MYIRSVRDRIGRKKCCNSRAFILFSCQKPLVEQARGRIKWQNKIFRARHVTEEVNDNYVEPAERPICFPKLQKNLIRCWDSLIYAYLQRRNGLDR